MRNLVLALLLVLPACENETTTTMRDMAMIQLPPPDMAMLGPLSCSGALACYNACRTDECIEDCYARDTPKAKMLDDDLFYGCPVRTCAKPDDGGVSACTSGEVAAVEADPFSQVSFDCEECMGNVNIQTSCATELAACMADRSTS